MYIYILVFSAQTLSKNYVHLLEMCHVTEHVNCSGLVEPPEMGTNRLLTKYQGGAMFETGSCSWMTNLANN